MSDEESFVILGSSPPSSLELDGCDEPKSARSSTPLESDTPGNNSSSLRKSQLIDLQNARETIISTANMENYQVKRIDTEKSTDLYMTPQKSTKSIDRIAESKLWSRSPAQVHKSFDDDDLCLNLENCAIKSPLSSIKQQKEDLNVPQQKVSSSLITTDPVKTSSNASNDHNSEASISINNSLASSFIMGEINADVLKTSVYSQFPSISMQSSAEEVLKLQNMVTENMQLKVILEKVNNTMKFFHSSSLQWQEKMNNMETKYKQELNDCQKEIEILRKENQTLQENLKTQIEALQIARQKDREETIKEISEKNSLVENMRAQILKLERKQLSSFEFLGHKEKTNNEFENFYVSRDEYNLKIKELERQLSELYASNLDLKDVEKQYVDELNCLKVNLTSAEELIKENRATIAQLHALERERLEKIKQLQKTIDTLRVSNAEQNERILVLEQQNEVYRKDFEMEQEGHNVAVKEKQHVLQDLKNLQKRNQELIEEHQKLVDNYEKRLNFSQKSSDTQSFVSSAAAAQTYSHNPQRPIRVSPNLPPISSNTSPTLYCCPICNKGYKSLNILESHVNGCIDDTYKK